MNHAYRNISRIVLAGVIGTGILSSFPTVSAQAAVDHEHELIELNRGAKIKNANFEQDGNWNFANAGIVQDEFSDGRSACITPTNHNAANGHIWQEITLKPNTDYTLTAKVRIISDSPTTSAALVVKTGTLASPVNFKQTLVSADTGDWQTVTLSFNTQDKTSFILGLDRWIENATEQDKNSKVYFDSVTITGNDESTSENYEIVWADDFNSNALDTAKWGYELGCVRGVEQQHYVKDPENVYVSDGQLTLQITDRNPEDQYKNPRGNRQVIYDSGSVRTHGKQEFLYGRFEMRAKLPRGKGAFPAFWTLGADFGLDDRISPEQSQPWPACGEVDIMELVGKADDSTGGGNQTVWQTLHYGEKDDNGKYAGNGTAYSLPNGIFNDDYHIFGLNWTEGKMEWYVDDQIVRTVDYSDDELAMLLLDRPQYIQVNLAAGGNWPGDAAPDLAGQKFEIDYIYYAQTEEQKQAAQEYYANAATIEGVKDVTITQGDIPNLLEGVTSTKETVVDFSIENEHMFKNEGGNSSVDLVCTGKNDAAKIATLPAGQYNIHYTAKLPENNGLKPMVRRSSLLTVNERSFSSDLQASGLSLVGFENDTLSTIQLPEHWSWKKPNTVISSNLGEIPVVFSNNGFTKEDVATIKTESSVTKQEFEQKLKQAKALLEQTNTYTAESLAVLETAAKEAQSIFNNSNATFAELTAAYQKMQNGIDQLKKVEPTSTPAPTSTPVPTATPTPTATATPTSTPAPTAAPATPAPTAAPQQPSAGSPQTGDSALWGVWALAATAIGFCGFSFVQRKKHLKK